jgi:hypothetical protein
LLKADQSDGRDWMTDREIARALDCDDSTVERVRRKFVEEGFDACLTYGQRSDAGVPRIVDGDVEAHLIAVACGPAPEGRSKWTLNLIA